MRHNTMTGQARPRLALFAFDAPPHLDVIRDTEIVSRQNLAAYGLRTIIYTRSSNDSGREIGAQTMEEGMEYPQFGLNGRVALVTGAARGLGRAISLALANGGADVALGLRDLQADSGLAAEISKMGRKVLPLQMDMRRMDQISSAVDQTAKQFGRIDVLVNNAGIAPENPAE